MLNVEHKQKLQVCVYLEKCLRRSADSFLWLHMSTRLHHLKPELKDENVLGFKH